LTCTNLLRYASHGVSRAQLSFSHMHRLDRSTHTGTQREGCSSVHTCASHHHHPSTHFDEVEVELEQWLTHFSFVNKKFKTHYLKHRGHIKSSLVIAPESPEFEADATG
jgi:hypothetical protein